MVSDLLQVLEVLKPLGIAGMAMFGGLWWLTRKELLACQKSERELHAQTSDGNNKSANAIALVAAEFHELRDDVKEAEARTAQLLRLVIKKLA